MRIKLADGGYMTPKAHHVVKCNTHNISITWGELDDIQRLAVKENICTVEDSKCLMLMNIKREK